MNDDRNSMYDRRVPRHEKPAMERRVLWDFVFYAGLMVLGGVVGAVITWWVMRK